MSRNGSGQFLPCVTSDLFGTAQKSWVSRVVQYVSEQFQGTYGIWSHSMSAQHCPDRSGSIDAEKTLYPDITAAHSTHRRQTIYTYKIPSNRHHRNQMYTAIKNHVIIHFHNILQHPNHAMKHNSHRRGAIRSWRHVGASYDGDSPLPCTNIYWRLVGSRISLWAKAFASARWYVEVRRLLLCGTNGSSHVSNTSGFFVPQERTRIEKVLRIFLTAEGFSSLLNTISYDTL